MSEHGFALAGRGRVAGCGLTLAYREWHPDGPGEPLVLLHGITGSSSDWERTVRHLGSRRVVAIDARGHGESDWDQGEAYGGDQHFADLATALHSLGVERCVLVGFSMGGGVAMLTAAGNADRISAVVVVDAYPDPRMTAGSRRIAGWVAAHEGGAFDPAISRRFREQLAAGQDERLDLWPMWEAIECPALVVRGELSDVLPARTAAEMLARQARASLASIPGAGHEIPYARPKELAHAITHFLDHRERR